VLSRRKTQLRIQKNTTEQNNRRNGSSSLYTSKRDRKRYNTAHLSADHSHPTKKLSTDKRNEKNRKSVLDSHSFPAQKDQHPRKTNKGPGTQTLLAGTLWPGSMETSKGTSEKPKGTPEEVFAAHSVLAGRIHRGGEEKPSRNPGRPLDTTTFQNLDRLLASATGENYLPPHKATPKKKFSARRGSKTKCRLMTYNRKMERLSYTAWSAEPHPTPKVRVKTWQFNHRKYAWGL